MGAKLSVSPGTLVFAGVGLVASLWLLLSGTKNGYDGGTQRLKVPQVSRSAEQQSAVVSDISGGTSGGKIIHLSKADPDELVAIITQRSIFRKKPDVKGETTPSAVPAQTKQQPVPLRQVPLKSVSSQAGKQQEEKPFLPPKLVLRGVAVLGETEYALISGADFDEGYYSEGSEIAGTGISVDEINANGVTLVKDGYSWKITMSDTFKSTPLSGGIRQ